MTNLNIAHLKITLKHINPPVSREVEVSTATILDQLHLIIQAVMGWENCHLWEFQARNTRWGPIDPQGGHEEEKIDAVEALLADLIGTNPSDLTYIYDFGDYWQHAITIEKHIEAQPGVTYPRLLNATGACPPEDVGGEPGYELFLAAISDPAHPEHEQMKTWAGGAFDPHEVSIEMLRIDLATLV